MQPQFVNMTGHGNQIQASVLAGSGQVDRVHDGRLREPNQNIGAGGHDRAREPNPSIGAVGYSPPPPSHPGDTKVGSSPQAGTHHASDGCHCNDLLRQPVFCRGRPASEQGQGHHPTESFNITASSCVAVTTRMKSRRVTSSCNWLLWHTLPRP